MKNKRLSDQILILNSIKCVREEMARIEEPRHLEDAYTRLCTLYACLNVEQVAYALKQADLRSRSVYDKSK